MREINIKILDGVGAEIAGLDLAHMDAATFAAVQGAFNEHGLVFFRDQSLTETDHIASVALKFVAIRRILQGMSTTFPRNATPLWQI